ncbi:PaaI family thioesterase [Pseudahrensia aquimaris]|uniref:PaaI family thioesterase n=1 Tax=Pseudahrensia aquimaris TaxID=744461 RepID=A0ABW3FJU7_9HYPH
MASNFSPDMAPPSARWMGMDLIEHRADEMYSRVSFAPNADMINFGGVIQGGFLGAMMDDAMGFNTFISLGMKYAMATIDLHTQFLKAVPMGPITGEAWVTKAGKAIVFAEAKLYIGDSELAARATSSLKLRAFDGLQFEKSAPTSLGKAENG